MSALRAHSVHQLSHRQATCGRLPSGRPSLGYSTPSRQAISNSSRFSSSRSARLQPSCLRQQRHQQQQPSWVRAAGGGGDSDVDIADRVIGGLVYIVPLFDAMRYGTFIFRQFPWVLQLLSPLLPLLKLYVSFPLGSLIVFFGLYSGIINNQRFSRFVRYNGMQAVLLSIIQIVASLILQVLPKGALTSGLGTSVFININNSVFLFVAISVLLAMASCATGQIARLPLIAGAADQRVP